MAKSRERKPSRFNTGIYGPGAGRVSIMNIWRGRTPVEVTNPRRPI